MTLEDLGYNIDLEGYRKDQNLGSFQVGRVISEHKERYVVKTDTNECDAEIIGNLRFTARKRSDFPAVGDWVAVSEYDEGRVLIHSVFPRKNIIERQLVGKQGEKQIIATNIDFAFIIQAVDRDYNINRMERYLTICNTSNIRPIIILNKTDLINEIEIKELISQVQERTKHVPIIAMSNRTQEGIERLKAYLQKGKTYCLLGSSGVGKSTLSNNLSNRQLMKTNPISNSTKKGRHVTSHRELIVLENGGILIDNPGMREVGIADATKGLKMTFEVIIELSRDCKFKDCTHTSEIGCAVISAVNKGEIEESFYENYLRMEREKEHFELTVAEKRKKDKDFGKIIKHIKTTRKLNKY